MASVGATKPCSGYHTAAENQLSEKVQRATLPWLFATSVCLSVRPMQPPVAFP